MSTDRITDRIWRNALAARAQGWDRLLTLGLLAACGLLIAGLTLPIIKTTKFWIFSDELSLAGMVRTLWDQQEFFLSLVVLLFSLVFPTAKLLTAYVLWRYIAVHSVQFKRVLSLVEFLGKWSLADVLIVALTIVIFKATGLVSASVGVGVYPFAASILLTAVLVARMKRVAERGR